MAKYKLSAAMLIFGTIGIFVRFLPFPSSFIALVRGAIGAVFLLLVVLLTHRRIDRTAVRRNLPLLIGSGIAIGADWIALFEAYRYTTVATATLCYYLAPVLVILASPVVLHEKLTGRRIACVGAALFGMVLVSGVLQGGGVGSLTGVLLGLLAAVLYAVAILLNKCMRDIGAFDMTILQLGICAVVLLPYTLLTENVAAIPFTLPTVLLLVFVGIVHTGVAYCLYFSSIPQLSAQTVAIFSYIDPALAILLSAVVLHEPLTAQSVLGAVLILGSTFVSEFQAK